MRDSARSRNRRSRHARRNRRRGIAEEDLVEISGDESDNDESYAPRANKTLQGQSCCFGPGGRDISERQKNNEFLKRYKKLNRGKEPVLGWEKLPKVLKPLSQVHLTELPAVIVDVKIPLGTRIWHRLMLSGNGKHISDIVGGDRTKTVWASRENVVAAIEVIHDQDDEVVMMDLQSRDGSLSNPAEQQGAQFGALFNEQRRSAERRDGTPCSSCRDDICNRAYIESEIILLSEESSSPVPSPPELMPSQGSAVFPQSSSSESEDENDMEITRIVCVTNPERPIPKPVGFTTMTFYNDDVDMCL